MKKEVGNWLWFDDMGNLYLNKLYELVNLI